MEDELTHRLVLHAPVTLTSVQFVALKLACPHCQTPVTLPGRLELIPDEQGVDPCCVCDQCGAEVYLILRS